MIDQQYLNMTEKAREEFISLLAGHPTLEVPPESYEHMLEIGVATLPINLQKMALEMSREFQAANAYRLSYAQICLAFFCAANGLQVIRITGT